MTYDCFTAENGRSCVDGHVVLNSRVALLPGELLTATGGQRSDSHALIYLHVIADDRGLTDNYSGAVVNEEVPAQNRSGVYINSRLRVGVFRHHSRYQRNSQKIKLVCNTVHHYCEQTGI